MQRCVKMTGLLCERGGEPKQRRRKRRSCVTFQGSEVRAPLFPIQPMLWVLFQKVLSLANGPWSHEHMSPEEQEEQEEVREVQTARKQKKKKERARRWNTEHHPHCRALYSTRRPVRPSTTDTRQGGQTRSRLSRINKRHQTASHNINIINTHWNAASPPPGHQAKAQ